MRAKTKLNPKQNKKPIGIFDSGFGGLTVMSAIYKKFPNENLIYFGDTAHVPYGSKSKDTVIKFSKDIAAFLLKNDVKLIVVACNTASAFALPALQKSVSVPVIGVIEPGAESAAASTKTNKIGIIGTEGTINSRSYAKAIKKISKAYVFEQACPLFVPLVEEGWTDNKITSETADVYMAPLIAKKIDTLVLGCTHYPLLKTVLRKTAGDKITLIDSADAITMKVGTLLAKNGFANDSKKKGSVSFYVSDNPEKFKKIGAKFFSGKINKVKKIDLE
ncbi:MAG: glutamate racemase [Endomicrobia bacterium]|nr:glutamate racemase [Bacillota bacterium]MCL1971962.1 glutamate racemase [Endomicrobiia bacterium]